MSRFRLRGRRRKAKSVRHDRIPLKAIVPNLITSLAACAGITSISLSSEGRYLPAFWALLIACVCDGLDGRVARMLKVSSKLGAELDSLADFVNFGVAPALFLYFWILSGPAALSPHTKHILLAFALFYAMCDAFRLARFNTMLEQPTLPYWKHFFLGVPAPGGCWMVLTPVLLTQTIPSLEPVLRHPFSAMGMLILIGSLMASRLPTISLKSIRLSKKYMLPTTAGLLLLVAFLFTHFWLTLGVLGALYILTVPVVGLIFLKTRAHYLKSQGQ
jgi:CDP-diacylglycerol--serine O-phosphatidyltransferase